MTRAERRKQWRTIIDNQATSGMSIAAYCREHHLTSSYYYTWRRKLRAEQSATGGFLELIPGKSVEAASGVRIGLGAKLAIEVTRGFDPYTLRAVVETLKDLSRCSA
jgi:hypothetical protein